MTESQHRDLDELARQARQSADAHEGRLAMLEKRKPTFEARNGWPILGSRVA